MRQHQHSFVSVIVALTILLGCCSHYHHDSSPAMMALAQTTGPRRGMYLSLYADNIGSINLNTATDNLIQFYRILGDTAKEEEVLQWLKKYNFNAITLYDLFKILPNAGLTTSLRSFILRARAIGIECVEAATGDANADYDNVNAFNLGSATDDERFDGLATEIEFWGAGYLGPPAGQHNTVSWSLRVAHAKSLSIPARGSNTFYYAAYLGYVDTAGMNTVAAAVDYIWLHSYASNVFAKVDPTSWYQYTNDRMIDFMATGSSAQISILPSFEGDRWKAGTGPGTAFQGHAIGHFGLNHCEQAMRTSWIGAGTAPINRLEGFQYYEYVFAKLYMGGTNTATFTETLENTATVSMQKSNSLAISKTPDAPTPIPPTPIPATPAPPTPQPPTPVPASTSTTTTTTAVAAVGLTTAAAPTPSTTVSTVVVATTTLTSTTTTTGSITTGSINVAPAPTNPPTPVPTTTAAAPVDQQETQPPAQARGIFQNDDGSTSTTGVVIILLVIGVFTHVGLFVAYQCRKHMTGEGGRDKESMDDAEKDAASKQEGKYREEQEARQSSNSVDDEDV